MSNFTGRTMEWSGFLFTFECDRIIVRPYKGNHPDGWGGDLEFKFVDMRECMGRHHLDTIADTINLGSRLRSCQIRAMLGIASDTHGKYSFPTASKADFVFDKNATKYELVPSTWYNERIPWVMEKQTDDTVPR